MLLVFMLVTLLQLLLVHLLLSPVILVTQLQLYLQLPLFLVMLAPLCLSFTTMLEVWFLKYCRWIMCSCWGKQSWYNLHCGVLALPGHSWRWHSSLDGYIAHRLDRNRHGGGVLIYVRATFTSNTLPSHKNLEILTLTVHNGATKVCISLLYRSPHL